MDVAISAISLEDTFPSIVKTFAVIVDGVHTDIALTHFPNGDNLIITQFGKIGNLYQVKADQPENGLTVISPVFTVSTLLGAENIQAEVAVRYLSEKLNIKKPLVISLCLKNYSRECVDIIIKSVLKHW